MTKTNRVKQRILAAFSALTILTGLPVLAQKRFELARLKPAGAGMSSEKLRTLDEFFRRMVDENEFAGIVTLGTRRGKIFHSAVYGMRDRATKSPMSEDTIFRIFSMTKPITVVAMMILYEDGKWKPEDPIAKYIPEFANLRVFKDLGPDGKIVLENPKHAPTMQELTTHTAGFSYGSEQDALGKLHRDETGKNTVFASASFKEMIDRVVMIPLRYQPGTRWHYSMSVDLQGYIVEKLSGKPFAQFLKERIFDPLGMKDTGFYVPKEKWKRFATYYWKEANGDLIEKRKGANDRDYSKPPALPTGGGGLVSTAGDYLKFAQMLLNGGKFGGRRILKRESVKLMTSNRLSEELTSTARPLRRGMGWGYGFAIFTDPAVAGSPVGKGTYFWGGTAGTWFWVDPENDLVFVGMVQRIGAVEPPNLAELTQRLVYPALARER